MGRWTNQVSMVEAASMATCQLLSMGTSLHTNKTTPKEYRSWFAVVLGEMVKAVDQADQPPTSPEYEEWKALPNEPAASLDGPPHDEPAPEDEPLPTEDVEQTYSFMAAFGDGEPF